MVGFYASLLLCAAGANAFSHSAANPRSYLEKQFSQQFNEGFSILKHYGGNGPYSERTSYGIERDPPTGCAVDQVISILRHGERYPDPGTGAVFEQSLAKVYSSNITDWKEDLAFLNHWTYWVPNRCYYGAETWTGPYAGLLTAFRHGGEYRDRYGHLWDGTSVVPIFTSGYERVIETARKFGEGFFGYNYSTSAAINIISESAERGADSLTPTCDQDNDQGTCNKLTNLMPQFYVAAARINAQNPGLNINATDVYNLMRERQFPYLYRNQTNTEKRWRRLSSMRDRSRTGSMLSRWTSG
jgi:acid phosphatase